MKVQRRVTDDLTINLDLSGHALEFALEDGYTQVATCDTCHNEIPEGDEKMIECPECSGNPYYLSEKCILCRDVGKVDVCPECHNKWLKGEL